MDPHSDDAYTSRLLDIAISHLIRTLKSTLSLTNEQISCLIRLDIRDAQVKTRVSDIAHYSIIFDAWMLRPFIAKLDIESIHDNRTLLRRVEFARGVESCRSGETFGFAKLEGPRVDDGGETEREFHARVEMAKEIKERKKKGKEKAVESEETIRRKADKARQTDEKLGKVVLPPPLLTISKKAAHEAMNPKVEAMSITAATTAQPKAQAQPYLQSQPKPNDPLPSQTQPQLYSSVIGKLPPKPVFGALSVWPKPALSLIEQIHPASSRSLQGGDNHWAKSWAKATQSKDCATQSATTGTAAPLGEPIWKTFNDERMRSTWATYKEAVKPPEQGLFSPLTRSRQTPPDAGKAVSKLSDKEDLSDIDSLATASVPPSPHTRKQNAGSPNLMQAKRSRQKTDAQKAKRQKPTDQKITGRKIHRSRYMTNGNTDLVTAAEIQFLATRAFAEVQAEKLTPESSLPKPAWQPPISASTVAGSPVFGKSWLNNTGSFTFKTPTATKPKGMVSEWLMTVQPSSGATSTKKLVNDLERKDVFVFKSAAPKPEPQSNVSARWLVCTLA